MRKFERTKVRWSRLWSVHRRVRPTSAQASTSTSNKQNWKGKDPLWRGGHPFGLVTDRLNLRYFSGRRQHKVSSRSEGKAYKGTLSLPPVARSKGAISYVDL